MASISLEERIKGDGSLSSFICQERFLDLKISDWISHKRSNILNDRLYNERNDLFRFLFKQNLLSNTDFEKAYEEFQQLSICNVFHLLSCIRDDESQRIIAGQFTLKIIVYGLLPMIEDENQVNLNILSQLIRMQLYEDYIPFPD